MPRTSGGGWKGVGGRGAVYRRTGTKITKRYCETVFASTLMLQVAVYCSRCTFVLMMTSRGREGSEESVVASCDWCLVIAVPDGRSLKCRVAHRFEKKALQSTAAAVQLMQTRLPREDGLVAFHDLSDESLFGIVSMAFGFDKTWADTFIKQIRKWLSPIHQSSSIPRIQCPQMILLVASTQLTLAAQS